MAGKKLRLVVGLGNPGRIYKNTRHNAGFIVIDETAKDYSIPVKLKKFNALFGRGVIENADVMLAKPLAYMNLSGPPVRKLMDYYRISIEDIVIVHDDIDLLFGRLKIKEKGGDGGHKGVRSLIHTLGRGDFTRLRIGIGRGHGECGENDDVTSHVLGKFNPTERKMLDEIIVRAREAVVTILCNGTKNAISTFNDKKRIISNST